MIVRWILFMVRHLTVRDILLPYVHGKVLDVGCGRGEVGKLLSHQTSRIESLVGIDPYLPEKPKIPVETFDGRHIPFEDKHFDSVISSFILHHADDQGALLREMKRVGERVVVLEDAVDTPKARSSVLGLHDAMKRNGMDYDPDGFHTPEEWSRIFAEHGFRVDLQERLPSTMPFFNNLNHHLFVLSDLDAPANSYEALDIGSVYYRIQLVYMVFAVLLLAFLVFVARMLRKKVSGTASGTKKKKKVN